MQNLLRARAGEPNVAPRESGDTNQYAFQLSGQTDTRFDVFRKLEQQFNHPDDVMRTGLDQGMQNCYRLMTDGRAPLEDYLTMVEGACSRGGIRPGILVDSHQKVDAALKENPDQPELLTRAVACKDRVLHLVDEARQAVELGDQDDEKTVEIMSEELGKLFQ